MSSPKNFLVLVICFIVLLISACSRTTASKSTVTPFEEFVAIPQVTLPTDLAGLVKVLQGQNVEARIQAARVLANMGPAAEPAVTALTQNLYHYNFEVRRAAAEALGEIGPVAKSSVPVLIANLLSDSYVHSRVSAAIALGKIGETASVPALAASLHDESDAVQIRASIALALITGQEFPELNARGYSLNEEGIPFLVIATREWWENEGRYQDWSGK